MIWSFLLFLTGFALVGVSAARKSRGTADDYYLASRDISPALAGLSAVATNNSGYMFIGVIGYTYATGFAAIWLMIGWISGDYVASRYVHARLRRLTEATGAVSFADILSHWNGQRDVLLQRLLALISLVFLLAYASAQLVAGSKALHVLFDWPMATGAFLGAGLVLLYCLAGGIRASMWTDAAQSFVMIGAMSLMLIVATLNLGGLEAVWQQLHSIPGYMNAYPKDLALPGLAGGVLFAVSWFFAGLSVIGQPHVMVRFMALNNGAHMNRARFWYYLWFIAFYAMATGVGLLSRLYLPDTANFDAELALPTMALELLHPVLVGLVLAGVFAATLSTADSLILSCSAALTHDLVPGSNKLSRLKWGTVIITALALIWALSNTQSVFNLVIMAWSGLASALAPLLICRVMGAQPPRWARFAAVIVGLSVAIAWRYLGWQSALYEGMAGMTAGGALLALSLIVTRHKRVTPSAQ